jgi:hypothetical protein
MTKPTSRGWWVLSFSGLGDRPVSPAKIHQISHRNQ